MREQLTLKRSKLFQLYKHETKENVEVAKERVAGIAEKHSAAKQSLKTKLAEAEDKEKVCRPATNRPDQREPVYACFLCPHRQPPIF